MDVNKSVLLFYNCTRQTLPCKKEKKKKAGRTELNAHACSLLTKTWHPDFSDGLSQLFLPALSAGYVV